MAGFLSVADGLTIGPGGISRPSKRARSRSRASKKRRSRSRSSSRSSRHRRRSTGSTLGAGLSSLFNDKGSSYHKHGSSRASFFGLGGDDHYHKHSSSRASFFGLGDDRNRSRGSFFGFSKPSYYKRSSRHGFLHRSYKQLKRLLRDLAHWAKRHPWKVFFLVIMPLVSGGVLTALLARFGLRIPHSIERLLGIASKAATGDAGGLVGEAVRMAGGLAGGSSGSASARVRVRGDDSDLAWERSYSGRRGGGGGGDGWGDAVSGVAKMFI
ncbi:hypothetical protein ACRE_011790 [Hapsidospora chrysogenum ATCC 11550]|uniref:Uncharacterized protein n=1 Tax=Hapsidospora chrysogenum (strain ATCC 11550 / CBS 779.69 / DSM 880 / IAM 14645 / JCM 23072 / IMI 49137) TaxID=857340 RepID=A0A086TF23_HAPC1|nr:hypothetical protein ACRE_011790 [Hapsidospora chrysogenum ATCC 11550]